MKFPQFFNSVSGPLTQWCRVLILSPVIAITLPAATSSAAIVWQESTPLPEPRDGYATGVIDGRLILIGGVYWAGSKGHWTKKIFSATTHAFEPTTQRWEKIPDAPVTLGYTAGTQVGNEIFILGGLQNGQPGRGVYVLSKVGENYRWRQDRPLPAGRLFANAVTIGKKIYALGGTSAFEPFDTIGTCCTSQTAVNTLWVLDTADPTREWQPLTGYPGAARWLQTAASDGQFIYLFGGIRSVAQNIPRTPFNDVLRYDTAHDRWSRVADLPADLQSAAPVNVRGKIILIGAKNIVMSFDPLTARFSSEAALPQDASVSSFVWIDPLIVGAGGENSIESPRRRSEWTFMGRLSEK